MSKKKSFILKRIYLRVKLKLNFNLPERGYKKESLPKKEVKKKKLIEN